MFRWGEITSQHVFLYPESFVDGFESGIVEQAADAQGGIVPFGIQEQGVLEDSAGQPHQVAGSYGITGQADYDGGVQLVVFVQLFVQGFIFGIIFVTDGDIQLVGPGLLSFSIGGG